MDYEMQLIYKQKQVEDVLQRLGKIELPEILPIIRSEKTQHYRNRLDFGFSNRRWRTREEMNDENKNEEPALGFHVPKRFDKILDITKCWLQDDFSNDIRNSVKEIALRHHLTFFDQIKQEGFLRNMVIRNTTKGEWMVIIIFSPDQS